MKIPTQIWIFCVGIFLQHYTFLQKRTFCILCENFSRFVRKATFTDAAMSVFGSGYAWLVYDGKKLKIITTKNQDTPLCRGFIPILNIDVWEHAYYLKHYNDRKAYIEDFVKAVNWAMAEKRLCNQKSF